MIMMLRGVEKGRGFWRNSLWGHRLTFGYRSEEGFIDFSKDYYRVLGLEEKATHQEIKTQFYLLAKQHHPDKHQGDDSYFKELNEAYNVLSQPKLKSQYDSHRDEFGQQPHSSENQKQKPLSYEPYSQMSRAQWSYVRRGTVSHCKTDYSNYSHTVSPEMEGELQYKKMDQWNRAYKKITPQQIKEEYDFRSKLAKKYKEDIIARKQAKEEFYEKKFQEMADRVENILGTGARRLFQKLIRK